ncbi:MAG: cytochrome c [Gammaproteobacteria bacterium]|nr:cytochrome c [Gammaproteobacteria bacterium]MDD9894949.1 cytochrome c [Gammaproteobacteria bacterium]MDD9959703.1 cytochrome c [Gammaproteobacteria bacterium]
MRIVVKIAGGVILLSSIAFNASVRAQATVNDGVFTEAQATSGQVVYDAQCKTCHNMRFYRDTLRSWNNQPLLYLWESIMGTMPADNPGSLMFEEYTNVIAYILKEQGFPSGDSELDPDNGMESISIVSP